MTLSRTYDAIIGLSVPTGSTAAGVVIRASRGLAGAKRGRLRPPVFVFSGDVNSAVCDEIAVELDRQVRDGGRVLLAVDDPGDTKGRSLELRWRTIGVLEGLLGALNVWDADDTVGVPEATWAATEAPLRGMSRYDGELTVEAKKVAAVLYGEPYLGPVARAILVTDHMLTAKGAGSHV